MRGALAAVWSDGWDIESCWANAVTPITKVRASKQTITFFIYKSPLGFFGFQARLVHLLPIRTSARNGLVYLFWCAVVWSLESGKGLPPTPGDIALRSGRL